MNEFNAPMINRIPCEGWWEQEHFSRQVMRELKLQFDAGRIRGSGRDIIGPFTLAGTISEQGQVAMVKQYVGKHSVDYLGTYDGEGVMWGEWRIGPLHNRWLIKLKCWEATGSRELDIEIFP